ncbi:MAG: peptidoglycan recognition family protein [Planctomycetota bacterium]
MPYAAIMGSRRSPLRGRRRSAHLRRRRALWVVLLLLATVGVGWWWSGPDAPPPRREHTRADWTEDRPEASRFAAMPAVERITLHHEGSGVVDFSDPGRTSKRIEAIRRYHRETQGWSDIGYHYVVDRSGAVWEARGIGFRGAHAGSPALNHNNLGVLILGNFDEQPLPPEQRDGLEEHLARWLDQYGLDRSHVQLHSHVKETACPGEAVRSWFDEWSGQWAQR